MNKRPDHLYFPQQPDSPKPSVCEVSDVAEVSHKDYPLTKQQQALWIEHCLHPDNTSYNTCVKLKLSGKLDAIRFRQASQMIINYFDSLKVYIVEKAGVPFQRIDSNAVYLPEFIDISEGAGEETAEKARQARELLSSQLNTAIDLKKFPIMRGVLIKSAEYVHYYIGMVPHIVSDGRAAILYLESLSIAYNSGEQGLIDTYGATRKNWDDYYRDGLDQADEAVAQQSKKHWQKRLKGASHYFDYSYGKKQIKAGDKQGERVYFDLSVELSQRLKTHSKANRTTLFNVFVCIFSIFVQRYYGLLDVLIGYPVNIRPKGYKDFFGFFVNIVPLRVNMRGNPSYAELLKRVHETRKEDKKYQKYPGLDIVSSIRESVPDFDGRVFNLSMAQTVSRLFDLQLDGIESQPLDSEYYDVNDDFSLSYELIEGRIGLWFEYRKALFDRSFIGQAMGHIEKIIQQILDHPEQLISDFRLLDNQQERRILEQFTRPNNERPLQSPSVHSSGIDSISGLFEAQVLKTPHAIAVIDPQLTGEHRQISYEHLNRRANQLANVILGYAGNKPVAIGVFLERGSDLIISLLAILKAGCYYIPIPTNYPRKRTDYILQESNTKILIRQSPVADSRSNNRETGCNNQVIYIDLDTIEDELRSQDINNLELGIEADHRAYVIYTSGSTGKPKGVVLKHKNVTPRLRWLGQYFALTGKDKMLQNTDFSFDVSVAEIFWPLTSGVPLVIADQKMSRDPGYLLGLIDQYEITTSCMVPSLLNALLDTDKNKQLSSMRQVLSAGEILPESVAAKFFECTSARLYNFYGPTEAAIYTTFTECLKTSNKPITIGKPLGDTATYILDENLNILPIGVVGELYIGGVGIAEGYLGNKELTDKHFISDPFTNAPDMPQEHLGARLYRTGDLARFDFDGDIEFIGRKDKQVKIRGFRVELGEIENTVLQCPEISDVAVIDHQRQSSHVQLVAYLARGNQSVSGSPACPQETGSQERSTQADRLETEPGTGNDEFIIEQARHQISSTLPPYMMPSLFFMLDQIPRSLSGKLERPALPSPENILNQKLDFRAAESTLEKKISDIWASILGIKANKLDVNTSFFDLGGDSLMAIQFVSLAEQHNVLFDMGDIFESRSISELATVAKVGQVTPAGQKEVSGRYPLLPRQAKFFADNFENPDLWNRTFSFDVEHELDHDALIKSLDAVMQHHDNLRVRFIQHTPGHWLQEIQSRVVATELFTAYDLCGLSVAIQNETIVEKINQHHQRIRLSEAPLIQVVYFRTARNQGKLIILFHHLLLDMVSSRIIFEDLVRAYEARRAGVSVIFPNKSNSVKAWVNHLQGSLKNNQFSDALTYWGNFPQTAQPSLPFDSSTVLDEAEIEKRNTEANAKLKMFSLDKTLTQHLLVDVPTQTTVRIQDFLLANLFSVISNWSSTRSMTVSVCGHGRPLDSTNFNLSRTVGWLNTVFPIHLNMRDIPQSELQNPKEFLIAIQRQIAKVPANNMDYNLLRYSARNPDICKHQSPQIFFNYVGQLDSYIPDEVPFKPALDLPGIISVAGDNHLCYLLYLEAGVIEGQLTFRLTYSEALFTEATIDQLAGNLLATIKQNVQNLLH